MRYNPHNYQSYSIKYIKEHPIAAVILAMGMGKTSITLTAIEELMYDSFEISKVLIIAPLRVASTVWSDEIKQWDHLSHLTYSKIIGTEKERLAAIHKKADIYLINRENVQWLIEKSGSDFDYDMVVIDELSSFKNWNSKRFKSFMKVRPRVKRVVGLTGTPASNSLMDLFGEIKILDMGERLGRFITQYRNNYFMADRWNGNIVYSYKLLPGAEERIYDKISDITISMKAMDHLKMPELINTRYPVYMSDKEKSQYDEMQRDLILLATNDEEVTAANAAALSNKLCQMANGAVYLDSNNVMEIHDRKLDALEDIIEAANGNPILVAYWFQHDLSRIKQRLEKFNINYARLTTEDNIRKWNNGEISVGLIHPASAGHGLNLQKGGSTIVWFGLTWSLELYQQTNARLWRQGQASDTVVIQHIVTYGTIDERILKALTDKDATQTALIDAVKAQLEV